MVVVLVHGFGYTLREVAELTGMRRTTVQNHSDCGLWRCLTQWGRCNGGQPTAPESEMRPVRR